MEQKSVGQVKWNTEVVTKKNVGPKYSRFSESLRHVTPSTLQCSMFCGGKQCKYENPSKVKDRETVIKGLYSAWVTDNILAMARPSTKIITEYNIIDQFCQCGIKSVINLQHPGEHASCGFGLEESGFSYNPEEFMQADIFFYNFGWNDYGVRSLESILDMVKVMSFALQEGKAAVHCHAGLGRTGVLIACYLIYAQRISAAEAVHLVRKARPKAVQTRAQIECVHDFFKFVSPSWIVFPSSHSGTRLFTLLQCLARQKHLLHGYEARYLKYIPKVIELVCSRLLELANITVTDRSNSPMNWSLPSGVNSELSDLSETDLNKNTTDNSGKEQIHYVSDSQEPTENPLEIKHNPFVDSVIPIEAKVAILDRVRSNLDLAEDCSEAVEKIGNLSLNLSSRYTDDISKSKRRVSDSSISYYSSGKTGLSPLKLPLQPRLPVSDEKQSSARPSSAADRNLSKKKAKPLKSSEAEASAPPGDPISGYQSPVVSTESPDVSTRPDQTDVMQVARALSTGACGDIGVNNRIERLKRKINSSDEAWDEIKGESDPLVLARLGWGWLDELSEPALSRADVELLVDGVDEPLSSVKRLKKLVSVPEELFDRVLRRLAMVLTHCNSLSLTRRQKSLDQGHASSADLISRDNESVAYQLLLFLRALIRRLRTTVQPGDTSSRS